MIKFKNVYVQYVKDFHLLYNANFKIEKNTFFVGDEFTGSSSILRLIAKIESNYTGEIFIENQNIKDIKDKELSVAYVSKNPTLFKHKSIYKSLYYPLKKKPRKGGFFSFFSFLSFLRGILFLC